MIAILSPAKTIDESKAKIDIDTTTPRFLEKSERIMNELKKYEIPELCKLMKINDKLGELNFMRNQDWKPFDGSERKAAVLSFHGEAYKGLDAQSFDKEDLEFCDKHLRILSAVYGSIRPLDGLMPYRLEMGLKLSVDGSKNLYDFWSDTLTESMIDDLSKDEEGVLVNLASDEYSKVLKLKGKVRVVTPIFKERRGFDYKIVTIYAKKARGMLVNYMVKNRLTNVEELKNFDEEGYEFNEELSDKDNFVFTRENF